MTIRDWILLAECLFPTWPGARKRRWIRAARYAASCKPKRPVRISATHVEARDQVFAQRTTRGA